MKPPNARTVTGLLVRVLGPVVAIPGPPGLPPIQWWVAQCPDGKLRPFRREELELAGA